MYIKREYNAMNKKKHFIIGLSFLVLSGCSSLEEVNQTSINRASVSYSNSILTTTDVPEIEPDTPVAKAIEFMESSNPELITENSTDNKPEMVSSHIYLNNKQKDILTKTEIKNEEKHNIKSQNYFFPGQIEIKKPKQEPVIKENIKNIPSPDMHSAFTFSD